MPRARTQAPFVGIDLGGTNMQIGVLAADGRVIGRSRKKTLADEGQAKVIGRLVSGIEEACAEAGISPARVGGVGIGAPGAVDPNTGVVLEAVNLRWDNVPLARILKAKLKRAVFVENDVNVAIYGEWKAGAAIGDTDVLGVWAGTGIGGGLVLNNALYGGGFLTAGEIGHMVLIPGAPLGRKTVEQNCSRTAVVDRIVALIRSNHKSVLTQMVEGDLSQIKSKIIAAAYKQDDRLTTLVLNETAELLGTMIGSVVTLLSIKKVVLGGGLTEAVGEKWVKEVRRVVREVAFPARCKQVEVVASALEDDAGLIGAAMLARENLSR